MAGKSQGGFVEQSVRDALDATGLEWWTEEGKKHRKVFLAGRLAAVVAHGNHKREFQRNLAPRTVKSIARLAQAIRDGRA